LLQCITPAGRVRPRLTVSERDAKSPSEPLHLRSSMPTVFLTALEAAAVLRISAVTLGRWRIEGHGPRFAKFGRRVLYDRSELLAWAQSQTRQSTSEQ
jgi:excisionase family DNA binding protein